MKSKEELYQQIIVACSAPNSVCIHRDKITPLISTVTDWQRLLQTATHLRALPIVSDRLLNIAQQPTETSIPKAISEKMNNALIAASVRYARMTHALLLVMEALRRNNIEALTYKGAVLAHTIYDTPSLRHFDDIDILVHNKDMSIARETIAKLGYQEIQKLPPSLEKSPFRPNRPYTMMSKDGSHTIDLAATLHQSYYAPRLWESQIWDNRRMITLENTPIPTLSQETQLLYLCVHGAKHLWSRPSWIADVAGILTTKKQPDYQKTIQLAKKRDELKMLLIAASLAKEAYNIPLPPELTDKIHQDGTIQPLCKRITELQHNQIRGKGVSVKVRYKLQLHLRQHLHAKLRYTIKFALFIREDEIRKINLPLPLHPLYYLIRPLRLITSSIQRIIKYQS